jgi:hypothetical protein
MKKVTITFQIPKDSCQGCKFVKTVEHCEVGMSLDTYDCDLFDVDLGYRPIPCKECKKMYEAGTFEAR